MMPKELLDPQMSDALEDLRLREEPFAVATIVRTAGATAAKPGAKALLRRDGTILHGWLGGGCTRGAVTKATLKAFSENAPQLISIAPDDVLSEKGLTAGDEVEGVKFARNGCPSRGTIDIFVEPCLPRPELVIFGASPVATALNQLATQFDWDVNALSSEDTLPKAVPGRRRVIVIATQGQGDLAALRRALTQEVEHLAFVGSRMKYASLTEKLDTDDIPRHRIDKVQAPAGLNIGAVTPEEIALAILADLTQIRRQTLTGDPVSG